MLPTVEKGAALLDQIKPDWWNEIQPDDLKMHNCEKCILGQLYSWFPDGMHQVKTSTGIDFGEKSMLEIAAECGFDASHGFGYDVLKDSWLEAIQQRKEKKSEDS